MSVRNTMVAVPLNLTCQTEIRETYKVKEAIEFLSAAVFLYASKIYAFGIKGISIYPLPGLKQPFEVTI